MCAGDNIHFRHTNGCSCESVEVFETENGSTWEGLEPPTSGFMRNVLTIWAIRARHLLSHVLNTGSGGIDIFAVKLTFELLTVRRQQHSFSTHERLFLWKHQSFWDRKCLDLRGTRTLNLRIHADCSNPFSYQGQTFDLLVLNTGSGVIYIFGVKLTFELLTVCGQQHSFSTHERMPLWKYQSFWDRKCLDLRGRSKSLFVLNRSKVVWYISKFIFNWIDCFYFELNYHIPHHFFHAWMPVVNHVLISWKQRTLCSPTMSLRDIHIKVCISIISPITAYFTLQTLRFATPNLSTHALCILIKY